MQLSNDELSNRYENILGSLDVSKDEVGLDASTPEVDILDSVNAIFDQRRTQRDTVLSFIMILTKIITGFFIGLVILNVLSTFYWHQSIVSDNVLSVIAVSFFVETIAVMHSITKELWHEDGILSAPVVQKLVERKKNKEFLQLRPILQRRGKCNLIGIRQIDAER